MKPDDTFSAPGVVSVRTAEAVVAALVLLMGLGVLYGSRALGSGWTSDGPGPGYFPFYVGLILSIAGAGNLLRALYPGKRGSSDGSQAFVNRVQLRRVLVVLLPATGYVLLAQGLGLYLASALYIALFMVFLGDYGWLASSAVAVLVNLLFFLMFEWWFKVPLYKGALNWLGVFSH